MKKLMKITFLFAIAMLIGVGVSFAQSATSPASAEILSELKIELEGGTEIDFGKLPSTNNATLILSPRGTSQNFGISNTGTSVARFNVEGLNEASITVTFDAATTLTNEDDETKFFNMNPFVIGDALVSNQASAAEIFNSGTITLSATGEYFIWVGGRIPMYSNLTTGTYIGEFNIAVAYN